MNLTYLARTGLKIKQDQTLLMIDTTLSSILYNICALLGVDVETAKSRKRYRELVEVRQFFFLVARRLTNHSTTKIASEVNRGHATLLFGLKAIADLIDVDDSIRSKYERIKSFYNL